MSALKLERPLVIFDLETTGVDVNDDRSVSMCMRVHGEDSGVAWLINPGRPIPAEASAIHGIYDTHVAESLLFAERALTIHHMLRGTDVGGFNVRNFDVPLLSAEFKRCGITWPTPDVKIVDLYRIYKRQVTRTLKDAYREYCGAELENAHNATADVMACLDVLEAQAARYGKATIDELIDLERDPSWVDLDGKIVWDEDGVACVGFGKHQHKPLASVDCGYLNWMLGKDFSLEVKSIIAAALGGEYPRRVP